VSIADLPNFVLDTEGNLGNRFAALGLRDYHAAARYVSELPYGRNSDRSGYRLALSEGRGTCSTKHALLAELAREHGHPVDLRLGIYQMSELNTPGVGGVLRRYGLAHIPEAHCYLAYQGARVDLTRPGGSTGSVEHLVHEERIEPSQIGAYKVEKHREFAKSWAAEHELSFEQVWRAREECIEALAGANV
jgi:hypothetical protein